MALWSEITVCLKVSCYHYSQSPLTKQLALYHHFVTLPIFPHIGPLMAIAVPFLFYPYANHSLLTHR